MKSKHLIILASFFTKSDGTLPLLLLAINETFLSVLFEGKARRRLAQGERKYYLEEVHWKTGRLERSTIWERGTGRLEDWRKYYLEEVHWKTGRLAQSTIWKRGAGGQTDKRPFRSSSLRLLRSIDILNCQQKGARRNSSEELSNLKQPFRNQDQNK